MVILDPSHNLTKRKASGRQPPMEKPKLKDCNNKSMAEEDALIELEAVQSVYGDDCILLHRYPTHIHVHIKPRTADISSQQFVEAVLGIQAGHQYPDEPPNIRIVDSKGLDERRRKQLISSICDRAKELASYSMLVALCEEAVERLSSMNHPDGDCPLCLSPLLEEEDAAQNALPFMKLMSCFHCFHCECIMRWWNWLQSQKEAEPFKSSRDPANRRGKQEEIEESIGICPVCRKVFHAKDIEHVLDLVGTYSQLSSNEVEVIEDNILLKSDSEKIRREKFEAILKLQEENNGLIEQKKSEVLMPGMYLQRPDTPLPQAELNKEADEKLERETTEENLERERVVEPDTKAGSSSSNRRSGGHKKNLGTRKHKGRTNPGKQGQQWVRKDSGSTN